MRGVRVGTVAVVLTLLSSAPAIAAGRGHAMAAGRGPAHVHPASPGPRVFGHHGFFHGPRGFFPHRPHVVLLAPGLFVPFGYDYPAYYTPPPMYYAPPPMYYAPPPMYAPPPTYAPPPAYYAPPSTYYYGAASDPAPQLYGATTASYPSPGRYAQHASEGPMARVVTYATGRYELRGDGLADPYVWVWVPNPPSGPPAESPSASATNGPRASSPISHDAYRWTDEQGVTTWTDRLDKVPARYRAQAQATR